MRQYCLRAQYYTVLSSTIPEPSHTIPVVSHDIPVLFQYYPSTIQYFPSTIQYHPNTIPYHPIYYLGTVQELSSTISYYSTTIPCNSNTIKYHFSTLLYHPSTIPQISQYRNGQAKGLRESEFQFLFRNFGGRETLPQQDDRQGVTRIITKGLRESRGLSPKYLSLPWGTATLYESVYIEYKTFKVAREGEV